MKHVLPISLAAVLMAGLLALGGCGQFFPPISTTCTTDCSATDDFIYVANDATAAPGIAGFSIASATLSAVPSSPYALTGALPTAMAINAANTLLYVGTSEGLIYVYTINSDGSLTIGNGGTAVSSAVDVASMQVDSTGEWLLVASSATPTVYAFSIGTGGILTTAAGSPVTINNNTGTPINLVITPNNQFVYVSLGTAGVEFLTFASASGALTDSGNLVTYGSANGAASNADVGLAVNPASTFLFITETGADGVREAAISTTGNLTVTGAPIRTGPTGGTQGPTAVMVDGTGSYVYVTNRTASTIAEFILTSGGSLTPIAGSPFAITGTNPVAITEDASKTYVAVVSVGGVPDLQLYTFDATTAGLLDKFTSAATGTDPTTPVAIAATH